MPPKTNSAPKPTKKKDADHDAATQDKSDAQAAQHTAEAKAGAKAESEDHDKIAAQKHVVDATLNHKPKESNDTVQNKLDQEAQKHKNKGETKKANETKQIIADGQDIKHEGHTKGHAHFLEKLEKWVHDALHAVGIGHTEREKAVKEIKRAASVAAKDGARFVNEVLTGKDSETTAPAPAPAASAPAKATTAAQKLTISFS